MCYHDNPIDTSIITPYLSVTSPFQHHPFVYLLHRHSNITPSDRQLILCHQLALLHVPVFVRVKLFCPLIVLKLFFWPSLEQGCIRSHWDHSFYKGTYSLAVVFMVTLCVYITKSCLFG